MKIVYSGYMDSEKQYPYTIIDMEQTFTNKDDAFGFIKSKVRGGIESFSERKSFSNESAQDVVNVWQDVVNHQQGKVVVLGQGGVHFSMDSTTNKLQSINGNGLFSTNAAYLRTFVSSLPSLYLALRKESTYTTSNVGFTKYTHGVLVENEVNNSGLSGCFWVDNDGIIYFAVSGQDSLLGYFPANSTSFTYIGKIEPLKIYAIRSIVSYAQGTVKDKLGNPFPNARITALRRHNMMVAGETMSDEHGQYKMPLFALQGSELVMVCLDDDGKSPDFEAQIYDRVVVQ